MVVSGSDRPEEGQLPTYSWGRSGVAELMSAGLKLKSFPLTVMFDAFHWQPSK